MKTELRIEPHAIVEGANVALVCYEGELLGQVTGADIVEGKGGIRIISKYPLVVRPRSMIGEGINIVEIMIDNSGE